MRRLLKHKPVNCHSCPLRKTSIKTYVPTEVNFLGNPEDPGNTSVDILFVSEHPTQTEERLGLPFAGKAGQILRRIIKKHVTGVTWAMAYVVRCVPRDGATELTRPVTDVEKGFCSGYVQTDIKQLKPKVVVLLGGAAISSLNPDMGDAAWVSGKAKLARINDVKKKDGITYVPTVHPAFVMMSPQNEVLLKADVLKAWSIATGTVHAPGAKGVSQEITEVGQLEELRDNLLALGPDKAVGFDTETSSLNRVGPNRVLTWQFAIDDQIGYVLPWEHKFTKWTDNQKKSIFDILREMFSSKRAQFRHWLMHNGKFDLQKVQRFLGLPVLNRPILDTQFAMYMFDENRNRMGGDSRPYALKTLAKELLGFYHYDGEMMAARQGKMEELPWDVLIDYAGMDGYVLIRLAQMIEKMCGSWGDRMVNFAHHWHTHMVETLPVVEKNGIWVDRKQLTYLQSDESPILVRMNEIPVELKQNPWVKATNKVLRNRDGRTAGMATLFGPKDPWLFNLEKKNHTVTLFFEVMDLEPLGFGKTASPQWPLGIPSVDAEFYDAQDDDSIAKTIQEFVKLKKLKTSYINSILAFLDDDEDMQDDRVRSSQLETRTVTGRLATKNPNTSQIPRGDTPHKKQIKSMFCAPPGHLMMESDYRQAEVRWWAQIAGDKKFAQLFWDMKEIRDKYDRDPFNKKLALQVESECDIHRQVASLMFGVPIENVTKDQRQYSKALTFGAIFGQHSSTLAKKLGIAESEAEELQNKFLLRFKRSAEWLNDIEVFAEHHGYVETPMGRRRHLSLDFDRNPNQAKRYARNSPIQGASSDMTLLTGCYVQKWIRENNAKWKVINLVHDAVYTEYAMTQEAAKEVTTVVEQIMTKDIGAVLERDFGVKLIVPFEIEFKIGNRMGHMKTAGGETTVADLVTHFQQAA